MSLFRVLVAAVLIAGLNGSPLLAGKRHSGSGHAVDAGGRPLANLRVELVKAFRGQPVGVPVQVDLTDARGSWSFSGVSAGQYVVRMVQHQQTTGVAVSLADASGVADVSLVGPSLPLAESLLQQGRAGGQASGWTSELPAVMIGVSSTAVAAMTAINICSGATRVEAGFHILGVALGRGFWRHADLNSGRVSRVAGSRGLWRRANPQAVVLLVGLFFSTLAGVAAYRVVGPYGDGPFGAGFRRIPSASTGQSLLIHDFHSGTQRVRSVIDEQTGRVAELRLVDGDDFTNATRLYLEATGGVRLPRDLDADGLADRWEYYADLHVLGSGAPQKVGFSLAGDGIVDTWVFHDGEGRVNRVEVSTGRDDVVDRWEYYSGGVLVRVETRCDRDGRVDGWFTYLNGILSTTAADTDEDGVPEPPQTVRQ